MDNRSRALRATFEPGPAVGENTAREDRRSEESVSLDGQKPATGGEAIEALSSRLHDATLLFPPGSLVDEYEIERILGLGSSGVTYLARNARLDRHEALKLYRPVGMAAMARPILNETYLLLGEPGGPRWSVNAIGYEKGLQLFLEEAKALARFDHPHIVRAYRSFRARRESFLAMEYIEGRSLHHELYERGPLPESEVRGVLEALADGLSAVHAQSLLHRDVKPGNVMLRAADGSPVLIDFGAVQHVVRWQRFREWGAIVDGGFASPPALVLTPGYAPIEQYLFEGEDDQGPWTDVYALGALAYEALSGRVPDFALARLEDDLVPPVAQIASHPVSAELASAIDLALAVEPAERPPTVSEWRKLWDR